MTRKTKQIICIWFWRVAVSLVVVLLVAIASNQFSIMVNQEEIKMMQTDTLDKLNEISVEVAPEELEAEPAETATPISVRILSPDERDLICRVVMSEARGEDLQGQMAIAQTILDRAELWNMTPTEVVQAPGQYAGPFPGEISDEVYLAVANVFDGGVRVFEEPVTHFYSGVEPSWADEKINRGSIGCHRFYY